MKKTIPILLFYLFLGSSCDHWQEKKLEGKWQAAEALEDGMPMKVDAAYIKFEFFQNGYYNFHSTLNYREAGTYSVRGELLYTLDTINKASSEKAVKILTLTKDSLFLAMNAEGKERVVKLFKVD